MRDVTCRYDRAGTKSVALRSWSSLLRADIGSHARGEPVEPRASHGSSFDKLRTSGFVCPPAEARPLPNSAHAGMIDVRGQKMDWLPGEPEHANAVQNTPAVWP